VSLADFQNNTGNVRTNLLKAIAAAANVSVAQVNITGASVHTTLPARRLLGAQQHSHHKKWHHHHHHSPKEGVLSYGLQVLTPGAKKAPLLDVFSDVHGSRRLLNLDHHLAKHRVPLHAWRPQ
jgi:hypothetical protein